ncbi:MAG: hypothetical protein RDV41_13190, partial [Planctomycetota bacterium]|nr:hypothetical protein [Planctomycetota bacterium]
MTEPHDNRIATLTAFSYEAVVESSGRYRIVHELGRSASGVVFKVRDVEDDSLAAAKVFAERLQKDLAFRADLRLVAPMLAGVFHPNMVEVYRLWENANGAFLAMDHVEGESLARILDREGE